MLAREGLAEDEGDGQEQRPDAAEAVQDGGPRFPGADPDLGEPARQAEEDGEERPGQGRGGRAGRDEEARGGARAQKAQRQTRQELPRAHCAAAIAAAAGAGAARWPSFILRRRLVHALGGLGAGERRYPSSRGQQDHRCGRLQERRRRSMEQLMTISITTAAVAQGNRWCRPCCWPADERRRGGRARGGGHHCMHPPRTQHDEREGPPPAPPTPFLHPESSHALPPPPHDGRRGIRLMRVYQSLCVRRVVVKLMMREQK